MQKDDVDTINKYFDISSDILKYIMKFNDIDEKDIGMYLVSLTAFLSFYGIDNIDTIINAYKNTEYVTTEDDIEFSPKQINAELSHYSNVTGGSSIKISALKLFDKLYLDVKDKITLKKSIDIPSVINLEDFNHEMNHIIKSQNDRIIYGGKRDYFITRKGIMGTKYNLSDLKIKSSVNRYLEEGFNQLQTEEIMDIIKNICILDIRNMHAKKYLNKIRNELLSYNSNAYVGVKDILKILYYDNKFNEDYNMYCLSGNVEGIYENFDYYVGENSFRMLSRAINQYAFSGLQKEPMKKAVELVIRYKNSKKSL